MYIHDTNIIDIAELQDINNTNIIDITELQDINDSNIIDIAELQDINDCNIKVIAELQDINDSNIIVYVLDNFSFIQINAHCYTYTAGYEPALTERVILPLYIVNSRHYNQICIRFSQKQLCQVFRNFLWQHSLKSYR